MKLYHGTSGEVAHLVLTNSLKPRSVVGGKGNWEHTVTSNPDCVYLTSCYAGYFAHCAVKGDSTELGIIEVDSSLLNQRRLLPDEDFLEQVSRGQKWDNKLIERELSKCKDMKARTLWFRDHSSLFQDIWPKSVEYMGTCCYHGVIPTDAITRVSVFDWKKAPIAGLKLIDPSITPINYKIMSTTYKALTRWLMGENISLDEYYSQFYMDMIPEDARKEVESELTSHAGITILKGENG